MIASVFIMPNSYLINGTVDAHASYISLKCAPTAENAVSSRSFDEGMEHFIFYLNKKMTMSFLEPRPLF